jgi:heavy metal translocating P-type ATPase
MKKKKFNVTGMTCSACAAHIEKNVSKVKGVTGVNVNLLSNNMTADFDESVCSAGDIVRAVQDAGYGASAADAEGVKTAGTSTGIEDEVRSSKMRLIWSIIFTVPLFYISMGHMFHWPLPSILLGHENALVFAFTQFLLTIPVAVINRKYFINGFKSLFRGSANMDSLIAVGSSAAILYGIFAIYQIGIGLGHGNMDAVHRYSMDLYFESAGMILTLITLGKFLEDRAKGKTSDAITKLVQLRPQTATVIRDGKSVEIQTADIQKGDIVAVKAGESIPVDGVVVEGSAAVDESALTGESIPVEKSAGDKVVGASVSKSGYITFQAEHVGDDTTLSQIIRLMEEAGSSKAPIARLADKISGVFVPIVIVIAFAAAIIWLLVGQPFEFALSIGISVLVISCPCALGLATPTAIMVGCGKGAEYGILIKSAESLETAHKADVVVLDKTGTITEGKPAVTDFVSAGSLKSEEALALAASLESLSEHPLARAVCTYAKENGVELYPAEQFETLPGQGVRAQIKGKKILAGNLRMMKEHHIETAHLEEKAQALSAEGKTPLIFADEREVIALIAVSDVIKPTSRSAIEKLRSMNLDVIMLTGDNKIVTEAIGRQAGTTQAIAEVMPQDKERVVREWMEKGKKVIMVGDGINDAPALARADVGVAIGAGTDIAIESADIVLTKSDLTDVSTLISLSRSTIRNIRENLFWALIYNCIGIPLAAGVFFTWLGWQLNPMFAAAAMSLSSVCVVLNALRLKLFRPDRKQEKQIPTQQPPTITSVSKESEEQPKGENKMEKKIMIEGMSCGHCSARVQKALEEAGANGVHVELTEKTAYLSSETAPSDDALRQAVEDAGYTVVRIQ